MTSDEIVKALRHCATVDGSGCYECPARDSALKSGLDCDVLMKTEAADLIERLEKEKAALLAQLKWRCDLCKNCEYSTLPSEQTQRYGTPGTLTCHNRHAPCNRRNVGENDFCSYGKRRGE